MDLGEIVNIQYGLLENKAGSAFNYELTAPGTPGAIKQRKLADLSLSQPQNKNEREKYLTVGPWGDLPPA